MESNEKQQLFAQKVQQQNTTLTSQLELYKERVRVLENINGDNNYLNEFLEADRKAKHFNQQAQSQFIRDQDIIRDLKQQRDKLDLAVIDYKRQKEEYQKTQTIFNQTQHDKEEKYLNDIIQLQAKNKDLENVVCKMGKSTETLRLLTNEQKAFRDNLRKSGLGYNGPYVLSQAYAKIPKLYRAYELHDENEQLHVFDSEDTLEDAERSRLKMNEDVNEMKYVFVSMENDLDETFKQNDLLKYRLLEASLAEDIKNLVITSCVEIRNKDLHEEIDRISKESKDVSNESKTADTVCNDAFEVTQELSKRIVELENDLSKFEAKSIALEIALQHKSRENNSLKTLQKENENFMASLQLENAHLKQTYKHLFESVQRSQVETNQCDEVKVKVKFYEIETKNIELEHQVESLIKENEHLKLTYKSLFDSIKKLRVQTKNSNVTQNEAEKNVFADEEKRATLGKLNAFDNENCDFESKVIHLEKIIAQKSKDFDDVHLELSNRTGWGFLETKFDNSLILKKPPLLNNERDQLLKQIASLESQLASQDIHSCKKEYHELRTSHNALKVKFDSLNRKKWNINVSESSKPKESVSEKVHTDSIHDDQRRNKGGKVRYYPMIQPELEGSTQGHSIDRIYVLSIMGKPLSPDRVFDFPVDESESHLAYDFFTPGLLPGYAGNPNNNNGWIEADVPLLGELGAVADEPMVGPLVDEAAEPIVEMEEQVIAPVVDIEEDLAMLFGEDDDFSDDDFEGFEEAWERSRN
ncbi:hypothetical protein Tco_0648974 [Tanacetum coccineum]